MKLGGRANVATAATNLHKLKAKVSLTRAAKDASLNVITPPETWAAPPATE